MTEQAAGEFDAILKRVQSAGITPALAQRLLRPFHSSAIHEAERRALGFIGLPPDESPALLLEWLEGDSVNAFLARGMYETFNKEPDVPIALTPSVYIAMGIASQVYVYAHYSSRLIVPDNRVATIREVIADPALVYGIDPYYFEELVAFVYELMGLEVNVTRRSGDYGVDVLAWHPSGMRDSPLKAIQVKRYAPASRVGIGEVQRMKGVVVDFNAQSGEIVTTSWFTRNAVWSAVREPFQIELTDFDALQARIGKVLDDRSDGYVSKP